MRGLKDKVAIVTGAAGAIGAATARRFIAEGAKVAVADTNAERVADLAAELGSHTLAVSFDATNVESIKAMVEKTVAHFGQLDVLDNGHALIDDEMQTYDLTATDTPFWLWDKVMTVNVRSYMAACKYAVPHMLKVGRGSIINIFPVLGPEAETVPTAEGASKMAIAALTKSVATQFGKQNIRCNTLAPGYILGAGNNQAAGANSAMLKRSFIPRLGEPSDMASVVAYLASEESAFIQAQLIMCDGGHLKHIPRIT